MNADPIYEPIYENWLRKDDWALDDAVYLLLNLNPEDKESRAVKKQFNQEIQDTLDTARRAESKSLTMISLSWSHNWGWEYGEVKPDIFIQWAKVKGYIIPEPFQSLLASDNGLISNDDLVSNDYLTTLRKSLYWQSLESKVIKAIKDFPEWKKTQKKVQTTKNLKHWIEENITNNTREIQILIKVLSEIYSINK